MKISTFFPLIFLIGTSFVSNAQELPSQKKQEIIVDKREDFGVRLSSLRS